MNVSVIIPNYHRNIDNLLASIPKEYEVIVVNNDDLSLAEKRNYGVYKSKGDLIYFVDDDNTLDYDTIKELVINFGFVEKAGIIGSLAKWGDIIVDTGSHRRFISGFSYPAKGEGLYEVDEIANAFMVRREVFNKIGFFDQDNFPMDMDEADLCLRAKRAGYEVYVDSRSVVYHLPCPKVPKFRREKSAYYMGRNRILFQRKHLGNKFWIFLIVFMPVFVMVYVISLLINGQVNFIPAFLKGVAYGVRNSLRRSKAYRG